MMKTKLFFIAIMLLTLSSCLKDYHGGGPGKEDIVLTSENYLYEGNLERFFLKDKIAAIDIKIEELKKTPVESPDYDDSKLEMAQLQKERANFEIRISQIIDLSSVLKVFPIPCDQPNGKCVPVRLEYLLFNTSIKEALAIVRNEKGDNIAAAAELIAFPGVESDLQYVKIPIVENQDQITVLISKTDLQGNKTMFEVVLITGVTH